MTDITIPPQAVEAAARAIYYAFTEINIGDGEDRWGLLLPRFRAEYREQATAALRAGLAAWPGAYRMGDDIDRARLCLPVPTKPEEETSMDEYSAQVEGSYQQTRHP